jgi:hypothetical protein
VIVRRYEGATKKPAVLVGTGETFAELALRRTNEAANADRPVTANAEVMATEMSAASAELS